MTAPPAAEPAGPRRPVITRHPVRVDVDGDFTLDDLLALPVTGPARSLHSVPTTLAALRRLRTAHHPSAQNGPVAAPPGPTEADAVLLHRIEASSLFRPPVRARLAHLTPEAGAAWLALAARWVGLSQSSGDLRFLNTACKLTGAVWAQHNRPGDGPWHEAGVTGQLAAVARLLGEATDRLRRRLANRITLPPAASAGDEALSVSPLARTSRARIAVLAGAGSRSAGRLVTTATTAGLPIEAVCWYASHTGPSQPSNYSSAWYPPSSPGPSASPSVPSSVPTTTADSWDDVVAVIRAVEADVVLLVGMPVVPDRVLGAARLGVLNAHNGALPTHRGMDAVGWALLNNQSVVCSLHLARTVVDAGEVIAAHPVPTAPVATLAGRVKTTQVRLLLAGAAHVADTGALPDLTPQPAAGTQFYRLHPHLKRVLDASPYACNDDLDGR
ncbi:formyltransferase family protein [Amycolatopsis plumensis]|uniref:Formyltransferase family protein n=1 Tax=Amycolatopsis plumensis TaxID=236508 RepID=A0ABV5U4F4_9PSEU